MTKEIINNNKEAFDYWLKGGSVLFKSKGNDSWEFIENWCKSAHGVYIGTYIPNDKYVKFRKALAEGKEVQLHNSAGYDSTYPQKIWSVTDKIYTHIPTECYRVKETTEFKVGDWVLRSEVGSTIHREENLNEVTCIGKNTITVKLYSGASTTFNPHHLKLWKPAEGELCIFWNNHETVYIVDKYTNKQSIQDKYLASQTLVYYPNIAPLEFIKSLKEK